MLLTVVQGATMLATPVEGICAQVELSRLQFPFSAGCVDWKSTVSLLDGLLCSSTVSLLDGLLCPPAKCCIWGPLNSTFRAEKGTCEVVS